MGQLRLRVSTAIAVAALVATPSVLAACLALCAPTPDGALAHAGHGASHHGAPAIVASHAGAGHVGHTSSTEAEPGPRLTAAGHACCDAAASAVMVVPGSGRADGPSLVGPALMARVPGLAHRAPTEVRRRGRPPVPPPSPPPASLVLRI
jgi:hypothetical protein